MRVPDRPLRRGDVVRMSGLSLPKALEHKWFVVSRVHDDGTIEVQPQAYETAREAALASWKMPSSAVH